MRLGPGVVLADLGGLGAVLVHGSTSAAAYVSPAAAGWLAGQPPQPRHRDSRDRCVQAWRGIGLLPPADEGPGRVVADPVMLERAAQIAVRGPVLAVAMSATCSYCSQLRADLAVNADGLRAAGITVLLAEADPDHHPGDPGGGEDAGGPGPVIGADLDRAARDALALMGPELARSGTPAGVLLTPGAAPLTAAGYDQVTGVLAGLSGAAPDQVISEVPTSCSVTVTAAPADELVLGRTGDGRLAGIAVRGTAARDAAALAPAVQAASGTAGPCQYAPITLTVERPRELYLLFRGGELTARTRTAPALASVLGQVLAGFTRPGPDQASLLCGALAGPDGAVLFPRNWMSELVKRTARLDKAGWQIRPEPHTLLQQGPGGQPMLTWPDPAPRQVPVQAVWAEPLTGPPGSQNRGRLLAQVVNWITRPATPSAIHATAALIGQLPITTGRWDQALTQLP